MNDTTRPRWLRAKQLRQRWGDGEKPMPNSTFHDWRAKGLIPPPEFPFGPHTPYWRLDVIEAHEQQAEKVAA